MTTRDTARATTRPVARVLYDIARLFASFEDAEARIERVLERLQRLVPYDSCALFRTSRGGPPHLIVWPDPGSEEHADPRAALERLLAAFGEDADLDVEGIRPEPTARLPWLSHLAVPLVGEDRVLGVLAVGRDAPDAYDHEDLGFLSVVAAQLAAYLAALQVWEHETAGLLEREQAARADAERARLRLVALVESAPDGIVAVDPVGRIVLVNGQTEQLFGYRREELVGQLVEVLLPERFRDAHVRHRAQYQAAARTRPMGIGLELRGRRKDGSEFPVEISLSPLQADGEVLVTAVIRDVTERKAGEERLRQQAELLELAHDAIMVRDPATSAIRFWNHGAEAAYGWASDEALGQVTHTFLQTEFPPSVEAIDAQLAREGHWEGELVHTTRDGRRIVVDSRQALQRDQQARPVAVLEINRDTTESKRAEEARLQLGREQAARAAAEAERARLYELFQQAPAIIAVARGPEHVIELANPLWLKSVGRDDPADVLGKPVREALPDLEGQGYVELLDRVHTGGLPFVGTEMPAMTGRGDGTLGEGFFNVVFQPLRSAQGEVEGVLAYAVEVTEQVRARRQVEALVAEVRASRDQLAAILAGVAEGITVQDRAGQLVYANDEAARLCGFVSAEALLAATPPEILSRFEILDERGTPFPLDRLPGRRLFREEAVVDTLLQFRVRATGDVRWSQANATPVRDAAGQVQLVVNVFHDVTDRRRAEETARFLAAASERLAHSLDYEQTLAEVAQLAVPTMADWCLVDLLDGHGQLQRLALAHVDPAKVRLAQDLARDYPADPRAAEGVWQVVRMGRPLLLPEITDAQLVASARDPERLALIRSLQMRSAIIVPLVARGRTLGAITLVRAETGPRYGPSDLAEAEEIAVRAALAIDNARLYREAQEQAETHVKLNAALREAMTRLEVASRARDEFLALASHDLKNPLTAVKGMTQLLQQLLTRGRLDVDRASNALAAIDTAASRLTAQIDALLDLSRLRMGRPLELAPRPTDLVELARRCAADYQQTATNHRIRVESREETLVGDWDSGRLERALGNLLANAVKYSPDGGDVTVALGREGTGAAAQAVVRVRDAGLGIPAADLARVFEPYQRGANVAGSIAGAGLGLASVRQIVEQHGGSVAVESAEGKGSTFTVRLPLTSGVSTAEPKAGETRR